MGRVLVIGGTGMLGGTVKYLVDCGNQVTVLSKSSVKYNRMMKQCGLSERDVSFISADYFETGALIQVVNEHIKRNGFFDKAVIWMRSSAGESSDALLDLLDLQEGHVKVYKVNGSAASRNKLSFHTHRSINMHHIILGFKIENGESRWLTNEEISAGVIHSLETSVPVYTAGVTEPWKQRPGK